MGVLGTDVDVYERVGQDSVDAKSVLGSDEGHKRGNALIERLLLWFNGALGGCRRHGGGK